MDASVALLSILGALTIGAMSPGPSFVLVARTSIAQSRRAGLAAALGMGVGGVVFAALALLGLHALLTQVGWLYLALKVAGGLYLIHLAVRIWRGAGEPIHVAESPADTAGAGRAFWFALATQLSNPKTAIVYGSIFAALLPAAPPAWVLLTLPPAVFLIEAGWYAIVAVAFSAGRPRAAYLRSKGWIDRVAASVIGALGLRLALDAARPG
ncbi:LysE family translocator [Azospirillum rugosum]|uniref:Threonine/homoserine/homoserine lactone efflux protein n=1 Tax=Azospirillum rugosum TaxID=416170 RepID=A0ABS4SD93_9PROT|nr:LysE family translocator [Azospirillum rugosum]MBP2290551.1 threonine/homoserine/homoserine lactone efflux protein [Azospirillum rugosum]MDQ0525439.1 threonine/homoserine/homoserine lactone efflux protein [Azospirillum rugosum]